MNTLFTYITTYCVVTCLYSIIISYEDYLHILNVRIQQRMQALHFLSIRTYNLFTKINIYEESSTEYDSLNVGAGQTYQLRGRPKCSLYQRIVLNKLFHFSK